MRSDGFIIVAIGGSNGGDGSGVGGGDGGVEEGGRGLWIDQDRGD